MKRSQDSVQAGRLKSICEFLATATGLKHEIVEDEKITISQVADNKAIAFEMNLVTDVLSRKDTEGNDFVQINFSNSRKILLTTTLIGFKPAPIQGLDMQKLPKVVTTPDLNSVFEAIEEAMSYRVSSEELDTLKKVYNSILAGGEMVGFDLLQERQWIWSLLNSKASA
jgi:hypothetical protein